MDDLKKKVRFWPFRFDLFFICGGLTCGIVFGSRFSGVNMEEHLQSGALQISGEHGSAFPEISRMKDWAIVAEIY